MEQMGWEDKGHKGHKGNRKNKKNRKNRKNRKTKNNEAIRSLFFDFKPKEIV